MPWSGRSPGVGMAASVVAALLAFTQAPLYAVASPLFGVPAILTDGDCSRELVTENEYIEVLEARNRRLQALVLQAEREASGANQERMGEEEWGAAYLEDEEVREAFFGAGSFVSLAAPGRSLTGEETGSLGSVHVFVTVENVDYTHLRENAALFDEFEHRVRVAIAMIADVDLANVSATTSAGSVVVTSIITPSASSPVNASMAAENLQSGAAEAAVAQELISLGLESVLVDSAANLSVSVSAPFLYTGAAYFLSSEGRCPEVIGSLLECRVAAFHLALSDVTAIDDNQTGTNFDPPGCYIEGGQLKFNRGGNNGPCAPNDQCLCIEADPTPAPTQACPASCFGFSCDQLVLAGYECSALEEDYHCDCLGCSCVECGTHAECRQEGEDNFCRPDGKCAQCVECEYCSDGIDGTCGKCRHGGGVGAAVYNETCGEVCQDTDGGATGGGGLRELSCLDYVANPGLCLLPYYDDDDFTAQHVCCACGGGTIPTNSLWWSVGIGICKNHINDWTQADDLGPNWGVNREYGWRMCDQRTDEECKEVCDGIEGCTMIANGFCCYLFKGSDCELDETEDGYETFSNSVAGSELCAEGCVVGTKCFCQARTEHCAAQGGEWCNGTDVSECNVPVTGQCSTCLDGCSVRGVCQCGMDATACERSNGTWCPELLPCELCEERGTDPGVTLEWADGSPYSCMELRHSLRISEVPLQCDQARALYASKCCTRQVAALSIILDDGDVDFEDLVENTTVLPMFESVLEGVVLAEGGRQLSAASTGASDLWVDGFVYCPALSRVVLLLAAPEDHVISEEVQAINGSINANWLNQSIGVGLGDFFDSSVGDVQVEFAGNSVYFTMKESCEKFTALITACNATVASPEFVARLRGEYNDGFLRACEQCGSQDFHAPGCVGDESYPWPAPAAGCFKKYVSCFTKQCDVGTFSPRPGMISLDGCDECPAGRFGNVTGQTECYSCPPGYYQNASGQSTCDACPLGRFSEIVGAPQCDVCTQNSFTEQQASTECTPCPATYVAPDPSDPNVSLSVCSCPNGTRYDVAASGCVECEKHLDCPGGFPQTGTGWDLTVGVMEGFMTEGNDPYSVYSCVSKKRCQGIRKVLSEGMCAENFDIEAARCARCVDGTFLNSQGECKGCDGDSDWVVWVKAFFSGLFQLFMIFYMYKRFNIPNPSGAITVGAMVTFLQTLQTLSRLDLDWPGPLTWFFNSINVLTLPGVGSFFELNTECFTGNGYLVEIAQQAVTPLLIFLDFAFLQLIFKLFKSSLKFHFVHNIIGLVFTKMFISVTSLSLSLFYKVEQPNGKEMVKSFPDLEYGSEEWWTVMPINMLTTVAYGITTISYVAWIVWTAPRRAATVKNFAAKYRFCFGSSRPDRWWWVLINLLFGFGLNLAQVVLPGKNVHEQVYTTLLALILFATFQFHMRPFKFADNNLVDLTFKLALIIFLVLATSFIKRDKVAAEIEQSNLVYSYAIIAVFTAAFGFSAMKFLKWVCSNFRPDGMTHGKIAETVWHLRDVSTAMLLIPEKELFSKLGAIGDNDIALLNTATRTMINVLFGQQASRKWTEQRIIMGGGYKIWDHNDMVLKLIKDTESGRLHDSVLQSCNFRLKMMRLARSAIVRGQNSQRVLHAEPGRIQKMKNAFHHCLLDKASRKALAHTQAAADFLELSHSTALTKEELAQIIHTKFEDLDMSDEDIDLIFSVMDNDNSGTVTLHEFTMLMMAIAPEELVAAHAREEQLKLDEEGLGPAVDGAGLGDDFWDTAEPKVVPREEVGGEPHAGEAAACPPGAPNSGASVGSSDGDNNGNGNVKEDDDNQANPQDGSAESLTEVTESTRAN